MNIFKSIEGTYDISRPSTDMTEFFNLQGKLGPSTLSIYLIGLRTQNSTLLPTAFYVFLSYRKDEFYSTPPPPKKMLRLFN